MVFWYSGIWPKNHKTIKPKHHNTNKLYNAKILLFGEHTVVKGSQALAMPLTSHFGNWQFAEAEELIATRQQQLPQFLDYLNNQKLSPVLDLARFSSDIENGLYFKSSIPTGYGLGSSGALCAAIYDRYAISKATDLLVLKKLFGKLESYFHGQSSGIDPLVCYVNQPLLIANNNNIQLVEIPTPTIPKEEEKKIDPHPMSKTSDQPPPPIRRRSHRMGLKKTKKNTLFLLDTHIPRQTAPYVTGFLERCKYPKYANQCADHLVPKVDEAITALLKNDWRLLYQAFTDISAFQLSYFDFMIPDDFKAVWKKGLASADFKLKICGAGGGGYLLGISRNFERTQQRLDEFDLLPVF